MGVGLDVGVVVGLGGGVGVGEELTGGAARTTVGDGLGPTGDCALAAGTSVKLGVGVDGLATVAEDDEMGGGVPLSGEAYAVAG